MAGQTKNVFATQSGIDIGALPVMLDVRLCTGFKREADGSVRKEYAKEPAPYPLQVCLVCAACVCACLGGRDGARRGQQTLLQTHRVQTH
jgi:hypothetical protein